MRAVVCRELVGPAGLVLEDVKAPEPSPGEVLIQVEAAALNFADTLMIRGRYQERYDPPFVPGLEIAGRVLSVGAGVGRPEPGERVMAVLDRGGFAEQVVAHERDVFAVPDSLPMDQAAGFPIAYGTAYGALVWRAGLREGEVLVVHGAAGGVGLTAVECGKALGARVIATARGEDKLEVARRHGADQVLDAAKDDLRERILAATDGDGADVVFDSVGGDVAKASFRAMAWEGRYLAIGFASGEVPEIQANRLLVKNIAAIGFYWGSYRTKAPDRLRQSFEVLLDWYERGLLKPTVSHHFPLDKAADALTTLIGRKSRGKIVLTV